jgi:ADP-ribose pyrophosphatase YjhB (NUDIX family)
MTVVCGRYPPGMYSCIAGFLDVGESLEECVRRESAEEVGILVEKVPVPSVGGFGPFWTRSGSDLLR